MSVYASENVSVPLLGGGHNDSFDLLTSTCPCAWDAAKHRSSGGTASYLKRSLFTPVPTNDQPFRTGFNFTYSNSLCFHQIPPENDDIRSCIEYFLISGVTASTLLVAMVPPATEGDGRLRGR